MTQPVDPDELLTRARQAITRGLQLQDGGDHGPAMGWLAAAAKRIEDLDAYLTMGGRLPSQWRRARPAGTPSRVDRAAAGTRLSCGSVYTDAATGTPYHCNRLRGHHGSHKHAASNTAWS